MTGKIAEYFKKYNGSTCGRFTTEQLGRDIVIPRRPIPFIKYFFQIMLPAFLLSFKAIGQSKYKHKKVPVEQIEVVGKFMGVPIEIADEPKLDKTEIKGQVKDESGYPVTGASVKIKGTKQGTVADTAGNFSLKDIQTPVTVVVAAVGYEAKEVQIAKRNSDVAHINLQVQLQNQVMGEVVVVAGMVAPSISKNKTKKKEVCLKIEPSLSIYPNPVNGFSTINVKWQGLEKGEYLLEVYNMQGALMQSQALNIEAWMKEYALKLQLQTAGNYVLRLTHKKSGKHLGQQFIVN